MTTNTPKEKSVYISSEPDSSSVLAATPLIYSVVPAGALLTIQGKNFGTAGTPTVHLGANALTVQSFTPATQIIVAKLPPTQPGSYLVEVTAGGRTGSLTVSLGAAGPQGPQGLQGPQGPTGPVGPSNILRTGTTVIGHSPPGWDGYIGPFRVPFNVSLPVVPRFVATPHSGSFVDTFSLTVRDVTNDGFTAQICRTDNLGHGWGQELQVDWIAFTPS